MISKGVVCMKRKRKLKDWVWGIFLLVVMFAALMVEPTLQALGL